MPALFVEGEQHQRAALQGILCPAVEPHLDRARFNGVQHTHPFVAGFDGREHERHGLEVRAEQNQQRVSGDTLLILLSAHFESVPFVLPAVEAGHEWVRVLDTIEPRSIEVRFNGGTQYPLQGRTLVLFTLDKQRGHRRASDAEEDAVDERTRSEEHTSELQSRGDIPYA